MVESKNLLISAKAVNYGLSTPRGVLIIGSEGSGKSSFAKVVALGCGWVEMAIG